MILSTSPFATPDSRSAALLLEQERADAERVLNRVRGDVLLVLVGAAVIYAFQITRALTLVNIAVLAPMLLWTVGQHVAIHRRRRPPAWLATVNAIADASAVTALLFGYGLAGEPELAVKSPIWVVYFLILAARPFTSSARRAAVASAIVVAQYGAVVVTFATVGHLALHASPLTAAATGGTSGIDEGAKLCLLVIAGCITTYATGWNERTLRRVRAQLAHQALHDPLTGLANRTLFRDRVEHALAGAGRSTGRVAVLFLDLDDFKTVNDSLGHGEGDRLLCAVSTRFLNATRGVDTVARLGGDEFAVLLENVHSESEAIIVADRIGVSLRTPIALHDKVVTISASIGIARASDGDGPEEVLRNADVAMYTAKNGGKGRYAIFAPAMHRAVVDRMALEADLREGIGRGELRLLYQPIVELATGRVIAVEALVRWMHPKRGLLPPASFIPMAEETGLIVALGGWVLREACRQGARWGAEIAITINLSGRQLQADGLPAEVGAMLRESGLAPHRLVLEITESVIMRDTEATLAKLHALKALGVRLAIDDFGTGYSSLSSLQQFPIDILKIDKAFVDGIAHGGSDAALARTIIALGDTLSLRTIAEGIEDQRQHTLLRELGCELGQGYLFAKPLEANEVGALLDARAAASARPAAAR